MQSFTAPVTNVRLRIFVQKILDISKGQRKTDVHHRRQADTVRPMNHNERKRTIATHGFK